MTNEQRRLIIALLIAAGVVVLQSPSAVAKTSSTLKNVVVIDIPGTTLEDWSAAEMPVLHGLAHHGATGLLLARKPQAPCIPEKLLPPFVASIQAELTPLHLGVRAEDGVGINTQALFAQSNVVLIEIGDPLRTDCDVPPVQRDHLVQLSLQGADHVIDSVIHSSEQPDAVMVISSIVPRAQGRNRLTGAVMVGPSFAKGSVLTSATTQRSGVVSLDDVAPTIGNLEGSNSRLAMVRAFHAVRGSWGELLTRSREYAHALALRSPLMRMYVWLSSVVLLLALTLVLAGRGRATQGMFPRTVRDFLGISLGAVVTLPAVALLEPLARFHSTRSSIAFVFIIALLISFAARAFFRPRRCMAIVSALTMIVIVADLVAGAPLAARSAISYTIASGPRFHGIGNELMGVLVAVSLVWAAGSLDRLRQQLVAVCVVLGVVVACMVTPSIGAKFGSSFVAVPAFGLIGARAFGASLRNRRTALGIAIATIGISGLATLVDFLSSPHTQTLVANVAANRTSGAVSSKIYAALHLLAGSFWTAGILIPVGATALLVWKRPTLVARAMWGRPYLRAALWAAATSCAFAIAFNDAGVEAAAFIALIVGAAAAHAVVMERA